MEEVVIKDSVMMVGKLMKFMVMVIILDRVIVLDRVIILGIMGTILGIILDIIIVPSTIMGLDSQDKIIIMLDIIKVVVKLKIVMGSSTRGIAIIMGTIRGITMDSINCNLVVRFLLIMVVLVLVSLSISRVLIFQDLLKRYDH